MDSLFFNLLMAIAINFSIFNFSPQSLTSIQIAFHSKVLIINGNLLHPNDLFSKYLEAIGTYDRIGGNGNLVTFYYDDLGITILVDK